MRVVVVDVALRQLGHRLQPPGDALEAHERLHHGRHDRLHHRLVRRLLPEVQLAYRTSLGLEGAGGGHRPYVCNVDMC